MRTLFLTGLLLGLSACGTGVETERSTYEMLLAGDPSACAAEGVIDGAIGAISGSYESAIEEGMPSFPADQVTATAMNKDINEVSCQAKITNLSSLFQKGALLKFTLRPSLDEPGQVSVEAHYEKWVPVAIETEISNWRDSRQIEVAARDSITSASATDPVPGSSGLSFDQGFQTYPAEIYRGPTAPLRLSPRQKAFVTRMEEAYLEPVNFGGSLVLLQFGCGTGCTFAYALDKSSGVVIDFPIGGEDYQYLSISTRADSALVWAGWQSSFDPKECRAQAWVLGKRGFEERVSEHVIACNTINDWM